ncbi:MAG: hypothetical protein ACXVCP_06275 [Bdellovibrio sp.]
MFKKFAVGCGIALLLPVSSVFADTESVAAQPMSKAEAESSNDIIEQLLNTVEDARINFQFVGTDTEEKFILDSLSVQGLVQFNADWTIDLSEDGTSKQIKKVVPKAQFDAKNLIAAANVMYTNNQMRIDLDFYDHYDSKTKKWVPRPLNLTMSNQFNKSLIKINFYKVNAKITLADKPGEPNKIEGTCYSEKKLTDFTGKTEIVPVQCAFDGFYTDTKHKIKFKYVDANPTTGLLP